MWRRVIGLLEQRYPQVLADSAWDNTGLLVEAPKPNGRKRVLLTIDLTSAVAEEAIAGQKVEMIISYHPPIFSPLKSITMSNSLQNSLLRLVTEGISVYSPHTALDAASGGLNDWLATGFGEAVTSEPIVKCTAKGYDDAGYGRLIRLKKGQTLVELCERLKTHLSVKSCKCVLQDKLIL
jgi:dinuclear metal center YbgI/SA1388 family protein